ncbi:unnamed protein product [Leptosia nina]|uniref:F-box domain-containing protein n=1 Tax=Leptosia nina TaxID=320188 RepID=A0AAV1JTI1_9NEOP
MEELESKIGITDLPDEIITIILSNSSYKDVISFGMTSKHFYSIVFDDQYLWKSKCSEILPNLILNTVQNHCDGEWLNELRKFVVLKRNVILQLLAMSPNFYWKMNQLSLEDCKEFFTLATEHELSYYYTIHILQQILQQANKNLDNHVCEKPYTLTEIYYVKVLLRYLVHLYLCIKWVKLYTSQVLLPEVVMNFCLQWIDPTTTHTDESTRIVLDDVVENIKDVIRQARAKKPPPPGRKKVTDREVLSAMTQVIYRQRHITITPAADHDTLNIVKVLKNKCGHAIALAVIYQAVARKCGVKIELITFQDHLFLEWIDDSDPQNVIYTINLETGELKPKRRCPFSRTNQHFNYSYCPDSLLQYIYSSYFVTMGAIRNWHTQNALHLINFMSTNNNCHNPYNNFFPYLMEIPALQAPNQELDLYFLSNFYREILLVLSTLNKPTASVYNNLQVKRHDKNVLFAVGMICYHKKYEYICIIRGWDISGDNVARMPAHNLVYGLMQPFYRVTAADQSERYVAQENLVELRHPTRLYHLEDLISKEFTHFDGFAYILNDEKKIEYPDENPIVESIDHIIAILQFYLEC